MSEIRIGTIYDDEGMHHIFKDRSYSIAGLKYNGIDNADSYLQVRVIAPWSIFAWDNGYRVTANIEVCDDEGYPIV